MIEASGISITFPENCRGGERLTSETGTVGK